MAGTASEIDLDAYCERIGYRGPRVATLPVLRELQRLHPQAIAFENVDPFLGRPVRLDLPSLEDKLVRSRRGGYCFEQNMLFWKVLSGLGFQVSGLAARVLWNYPEGAVNPRSHMLLRVELEGATWLADVGFGGLTQTAPLRLGTGAAQETPHEAYRIVEEGDHWRLQAEIGGEWRSIFRFDMVEHLEVDYAATNYFLSANPASHFVTGLLAARALPGRRLSMRNDRLTIHEAGKLSRQKHFDSGGQLRASLAAEFGIDVPEPERFDERFRALGFGESRG
ncbi:arylamine N-acetyltransferase [Aquibium sp. LZ166]|uniref:Arylamine N-acetyltransferase n=1 Tax=Aquibium pacificus TaxID=3153579 RepID=A0ABV3SPS1_9HYPH